MRLFLFKISGTSFAFLNKLNYIRMIRYLLLFFSIFTVIAATASKPSAGGDSDFQQSPEATHYPAMILVQDQDIDETIAELEERGIIVLHHRGNILLTYIPVDIYNSSGNDDPSSNNVRKARGVKKIEISKPRTNEPMMKNARLFNNAFLINEGTDIPQPYDGMGVVVGVCDIGMDTRHVNFLNSSKTECRIRRVVHYQEQQGLRTVYSSPEEIYEWQTDNPDDWHATHVTGIAAGGDRESGYYSLAPEADIVFTASQLSDVGLLAGVEDIIDYAQEVGKPAVINLSMGNYTGPHDGTSLFTRYLDLCAEDAIICLSAGNEGNTGEWKSMSYDFTEGKTELRVLPNDYDGIEITGVCEVWSPDSTPFDFTFYWNNNTSYSNRKDVYNPLRSEDGSEITWSLSLNPNDPDYDETFASLYKEGYVKVTVGVSPLNDRYCATVEFDLVTDIYHGDTAWAEYWPGIRVDGKPGQHVDIYCGGGSFLRTERGFPKPDNNMNISDLATGFKTVSVGMMNITDFEDGAEPRSGLAKGDVCIHSSFGTLLDGRKLPLTVAPGAIVISSISSAFLEKYPDYLQYVDDQSQFDGETYYWIGTTGTSMSCPFVVGAIATWLQAYPGLTSEEAIDIIRKTNQTSGYPNPDDPRHGQGWFNAYDGLQLVLEKAALKVGTTDAPEFQIKIERGVMNIGNPTGENLTVDIFDPSGIRVYRSVFSDLLGTIDLKTLPSGLYIVRVSSPAGQSKTLKLAL